MSPFVSAVRVKSGGIEWLNLATRGPDLATFSVRPKVLGTMLLVFTYEGKSSPKLILL